MNTGILAIFDRETKYGHLPKVLLENDGYYALQWQHLQHLYNQLCSSKDIRNIYVALSDDREFNAMAYANGKDEFVAINAGMAYVIPLFMQDILGRREAFPDIGEADKEAPSESPVDPQIIFTAGRASTWNPGVDWSPRCQQPISESRFRVASLLSMFAWDFISAHEFAHISRCHIEFLSTQHQSFRGLRTISEYETYEISEFASSLLDVAEADADVTGARVHSGGLIQNDLEFFSEFCGVEFSSWQDIAYLWNVALQLLFQLMAMRDQEGVLKVNRSHPHPDVRMFLVAEHSAEIWRRVLPSKEYVVSAERANSDVTDLINNGILWGSAARNSNTYPLQVKAKIYDLFEKHMNATQLLYTLSNERSRRLLADF